jgi:hypothetical protein
MFEATDSAGGLWFGADTNNEKRGRRQIISQIPNGHLAEDDVKLPKRQKPCGYQPPTLRKPDPLAVLTRVPAEEIVPGDIVIADALPTVVTTTPSADAEQNLDYVMFPGGGSEKPTLELRDRVLA